MQRDRVLQIYAELETLAVPLQQDPQLGLAYLRERMIECRRMQDQVSNLLTEVNRDFGRIRQAVRNQKAVLALTSEANQQREVRNRLDGFENEEDDLRYLLEAVKAKSSNLRMTSSDIRLLYGIVEQQIRLGEIQPGRSQFRTTLTQDPVPSNSEPAPSLPEIQQAIDLSTSAPVQNVVEVAQPSTPVLVITESSDETADIEAFLNDAPDQ